ncbi:hypothetical protein G6F40_017097 [Rhizopus arrhizus]|nr:hypothetical protein G6F40_017097 [Rhizopus arrhizus]
MSCWGCNPPQKSGRDGWPKIAQRMSGINWIQGTPAGLPLGIPGIGRVIDGAMQQAPQPARQSRAGAAVRLIPIRAANIRTGRRIP